MIDMILVPLELICIIGLLTNEIPLGILFVASLIITLYLGISICSGNKLTRYGTFVTVIGIITLAYTVCELFLHIDVMSALGL